MDVHMPLVGPPDYEYLSRGPWFVSHSNEERSQGWIMHTLEAAAARFWYYEGQRPIRRVVTDGLGATVMSSYMPHEELAKLTGTRETMEMTLHLVQRSTLGPEYELEVLGMVDTVQRFGGHAL